MRYPDQVWADRLAEKYGSEPNKTIAELRTKLEIRTWFLRASLALNTALFAGFIVRAVSQ